MNTKKNLFLAFAGLLLLCIFPIKGFAQRVTYSDLKYVLYHSLEDNEGFLLKKGFTYAGISDYEGGVSNYNYSKNSKHSKEYISISKKTYKEISYEASLYTISQNDYILFKSQVKKLGFILNATDRNTQSTIYDFSKGNLLISFWVTLSEYGFPDYYITLVDKTLETKYLQLKRANEKNNP